MSETAIRSKSCSSFRVGRGRPRHSDESTTSRSQTSTSCSSSGAPHGGSPRQRQNVGRSVIEERLDDRAGHPRALAAQPQLDHLRADLARRRPRSRSTAGRRGTSTPSARFGSGKSRIVRDGCSSSSPASVLRAAASHCGGAQATCVITLVRVRLAVLRAQLRQLPLDLGDDAQWRRQLRPSRWISSSAARRPPRAGRVVRERSAGRASRRRRSSRRAPTARRPRPRA